MKLAELLREIAWNLSSGTSRVALLVPATAVLLSMIVLSEVLATSQLVNQGVTYRDGGVNRPGCRGGSEVPRG